ncbi:hypothetical protein [Ferrovibrio sp.]|uniref:hypothetical protein n=1 Tax=Ferrovibrio sp. TaxID=1917215 RepID=UPI00311E2498
MPPLDGAFLRWSLRGLLALLAGGIVALVCGTLAVSFNMVLTAMMKSDDGLVAADLLLGTLGLWPIMASLGLPFALLAALLFGAPALGAIWACRDDTPWLRSRQAYMAIAVLISVFVALIGVLLAWTESAAPLTALRVAAFALFTGPPTGLVVRWIVER